MIQNLLKVMANFNACGWILFVTLFCFRSHSKYSFRLLADALGPEMSCRCDADQSGREGKGTSACTHANVCTVKPVYKDHSRERAIMGL